jgi:hypothetical protein
LLLPVNAAISTAQHIIVCGKIVVDIPDYRFANGSEIIFASTDGGITINSGSTLTLYQTHVHGCSVLWDRIQVNENATLFILLGSKVEDAAFAVSVQRNARFRGCLGIING